MLTNYYDGKQVPSALLLTVRQGALQDENVDLAEALRVIRTAPKRILTNMAAKRGDRGEGQRHAKYIYTLSLIWRVRSRWDWG